VGADSRYYHVYGKEVMDEWRRSALVARRIIKVLPDCLTRQAIQDIDCFLACEAEDDEAVGEFRELIANRTAAAVPSTGEAHDAL
jgi:hypothetical protein